MIDVISVSNMRKSDEYTIKNKIPSKDLMLSAALGIYNSYKWEGNILIVCGTGNNGGDGYALAKILSENGIKPSLLISSYPKTEDSDYYFNECKRLQIPYFVYTKALLLDGFDIIVDCLLGTGFLGEAEKPISEIIEKINSSGAYVISADINSGLNGDNGLSNLCVKSDLTVSIGTYKTGHFLAKAKDNIGRLTNCDIGITPIEKPYKLIEREDISSLLFVRDNYSNKGTYGYLSIIGGCLDYSGAVRLAQMGACSMRSGAGVVRLCVPKGIAEIVAKSSLEATICPLSQTKNGYIDFKRSEIDKAVNGTRAVCIGMGMGQDGENEEIIKYLLEGYEGVILIDADGLNTLSKMDKSLLSRAKGSILLTPHLKELERLLAIPLSEIEKSPIEYCMSFAKKYGITLLLKGPTTIVTNGEDTYLIDTGCAGMATAGSGDVLSGILGALLASKEERSVIQSVYLGAYINGYAGMIASRELGDISMVASDTALNIAKAIKEIRGN
ncbi:MAG: NAD(P)H-hydrate dehydratase [Clostridia bacterium]|nr:NAD(P)H-hydrate dehydratase [Clostridia bacterium]